MSYAVITINSDTKRIESARLYSEPSAENEYAVDSLPGGTLTDFLYVDGKYEYNHIETDEDRKKKETEEEQALAAEFTDNLTETIADLDYRVCMLELGVTDSDSTDE